MLAATPDSPVLRRLATLAVGFLLVATGVAMTIQAELGVAPWDVLTTGLAHLTGLPISRTVMLLPLAVTLVGWALGRRPGPGTILAVLCVGPILGFVLELLPQPEMLAERIGLLVAGFGLVACGITGVIVAELGPGPAELVMLALTDRGHSLAVARTAMELVCVTIGWGIGGQVGVGTALIALGLGPALRHLLAAAGYDAARAAKSSDYAAPGA
jgi:uncharacterized membrane protein YczE